MFASVSQRGREGGSLELCRALHGATGCERPPSTHHPHTSAASCAQYADPAVRMVGAQGFEMMLFDLGKMDATSSPATHSAVLRREAAVAGACGSRVERAARRAELLAAENVLSHLHAASPPALKSHHHPLNPPPPPLPLTRAQTPTMMGGWTGVSSAPTMPPSRCAPRASSCAQTWGWRWSASCAQPTPRLRALGRRRAGRGGPGGCLLEWRGGKGTWQRRRWRRAPRSLLYPHPTNTTHRIVLCERREVEMDSMRFSKLVKECGLVSRKLPTHAVDVVFASAKTRKEARK